MNDTQPAPAMIPTNDGNHEETALLIRTKGCRWLELLFHHLPVRNTLNLRVVDHSLESSFIPTSYSGPRNSHLDKRCYERYLVHSFRSMHGGPGRVELCPTSSLLTRLFAAEIQLQTAGIEVLFHVFMCSPGRRLESEASSSHAS